MSELIQLIQEQGKEISALKSMLHDISILLMKDKVDPTWVSEEVAASMLGYKDSRSMRRLLKDPNVKLTYRNTNGRNWQYSRKSIMKLKEETSNG